jgi:hypothetical protein
MELVFGRNEVLKKLEMMNKTNLDKVDGFVKCLIFQKKAVQTVPGEQRPLLARKKQRA